MDTNEYAPSTTPTARTMLAVITPDLPTPGYFEIMLYPNHDDLPGPRYIRASFSDRTDAREYCRIMGVTHVQFSGCTLPNERLFLRSVAGRLADVIELPQLPPDVAHAYVVNYTRGSGRRVIAYRNESGQKHTRVTSNPRMYMALLQRIHKRGYRVIRNESIAH